MRQQIIGVDSYQSIGEFIRATRKKLGVSQQSLGELVGLSYVTVSHYEAGKRKSTLNSLKLIAAGLSMPLEHLLELDSPRTTLDACLRSYKLTPDEIVMVKRYVEYLQTSKATVGILRPAI